MLPKVESHPHHPFVPKNFGFLIVGSFPGKDNSNIDHADEWYYSAKRNQFWKILREVYHQPLLTVEEKKSCFAAKGIAIADLYLKVKRKKQTNSDSDLEIVETNEKALRKIIEQSNLKKIFFTSEFVEKQFKKMFPQVTIGERLPSPSPRFARMSLEEKIHIYKQKLPK